MTSKDSIRYECAVEMKYHVWLTMIFQVECKDLDELASDGVFKEFAFICSAEFQSREDFRLACGCDDVSIPPPNLVTCEICGKYHFTIMM